MRWLLVFLIIPLNLFCEQPLAVCLIFQNDAPYLREWIEFHRIQGVSHFYLYNNNSEDNYKEILKPYENRGVVTLIEWDKEHEEGNGREWNKIQTGAYNHCLEKFGKNYSWIAFIDSDEFLYCTSGEKLPSFLEKYKKYGGLCVNWQMFGTSSVYNIPKGHLMIELLTRCAKWDGPHNFSYKSIVQPKYVDRCPNPHFCRYIGTQYAVNPDLIPITDQISPYVCVDQIRINHYWTRTEGYLREYKIPKRVHMYKDDEKVLLDWAEAFNEVSDNTIQQFVSQLKWRMNLNEH